MRRGQDAIIPINTATSSAVDLFDKRLVGIIMPASWTTASIAFKTATAGDAASGDNTFRDLASFGSLVVLDVAAGQHIVFDQNTVANFKGVRHIKFISWDEAGAATVNQAAARTIIPLVA